MKAKKEKEYRHAAKQGIAELKNQKKLMEKELDNLNGRTTKRKIVSFLIFLFIMAVMAGTLIGMVKLNVGGVDDDVLAPVIADVPVARSILPKRLQKKRLPPMQKQQQMPRRKRRHKRLLRLKSRQGQKQEQQRKRRKRQRLKIMRMHMQKWIPSRLLQFLII